ncbi:valine--tRNA ligase, mitochondrial isoform X2 [Gouania willdenowi]|uniref:Valine--tRNA ligase n=1 Tax=Gouania willdenowi TaxID=441366 RepID=A0A8C5DQ30_GOUWI|nr:valine--tRNA ligase, mitochondrial isoform X2 [Gouania willdenowi]
MMWRFVRLGRRAAARQCSHKPAEPPGQPAAGQPAAGQPAAGQPAAGQPAGSQPRSARPQTEKLRRRRQRDDAILSKEAGSAADVRWSEKQRMTYTAQTAPGSKKDTSSAFPSSYSPDYVESRWYQWWEEQGFFSPERHEHVPHAVDQTFSLCVPPPNVTGSLHLGHALTVAVEDALVRWRRMQGYKVLWLPGCDHAGIATQTVVERKLLKERGTHRKDLTREDFVQEVWKWKNQKGEEIYTQLKTLGASLDWSRACFTMDPGYSRAVSEAFVRLYDAGLIYRSERLVNWSCALESAISDIEVDSKELSGQTMMSLPGYENKLEFGTMVSFAYPVEGHDMEVVVSTTRPETMMGDVAVAVHPNDPRYQELQGKQVRHPFTECLLPVITDPAVDMLLGTGAVKVTPAHDHTDFLLSLRHTLPRLTVIAEDGTMTPSCGRWLKGVKRFDARRLVVDALCEKKLFRGKQSHAMTLPMCSRSGDVIEPLLKKQWFVRCEEMAQKAIEAVEDGRLEIIPHYHTKTWKNFLSNISDWCISRQLWWGHQIPAYRLELPTSTNEHQELWICGRSEDEARSRAAVKYRVDPESIILNQDPDVLDTWFSSGLFPFASLGWPDQTADFKDFYPNSMLETGSDLIFFWVSRMVMLGEELTGCLPFRQRLVEKVQQGNLSPSEQLLALKAQRMDFPQGTPQCGTDALRLALCSHKLQGEDISLSVSQVLSYRHFCNKMWQTLRFTVSALEKNGGPVGTLEETSPQSSMDRWMCSQLYSTVVQCEQAFKRYELHTVTSSILSLWVHSFCDVYLEYIKPVLSDSECDGVTRRKEVCSLLYHCSSVSLTLLAPFMPFITEELWQRLQPFGPTAHEQGSLCLQPYPHSSQMTHWFHPEEEHNFLFVKEVIRVARSLRAQCGLTKEKPVMWASCSSSQAEVLLHFDSAVQTLGRISHLLIYSPDTTSPTHCTAPPIGSLVGVVDHTCQLHLQLQSGTNVEKQILQLVQRRDKLVPKVEEILNTVNSPHFLTKVPPHVRQRTDTKVSALQQELKSIEQQLKQLKKTEQKK